MADEPIYDDAHRAELVDRILSADQPVPSEMRERYLGPKETSITSARGLIFGSIGAATGFLLGRSTEVTHLQDGQFKGKNQRVFAFVGGAIGTVMGLFSGSTEAREGARQVRRMQRRIEDLHGQNEVMKDELEARIEAERADEPAAQSESIDEKREAAQEAAVAVDRAVSADKAEEADKPETILDAQEIAAHEVAKEAEQHAAL